MVNLFHENTIFIVKNKVFEVKKYSFRISSTPNNSHIPLKWYYDVAAQLLVWQCELASASYVRDTIFSL